MFKCSSLASTFAFLSILSLGVSDRAMAASSEILGSGWGDDDYIVGGEKVESCDLPEALFVLSTSNDDKKYVCTATLVHPQIVVTAAHCLKDKKNEVATGDGYRGEDKATLKWRDVEYCEGNPDWKNGSGQGKNEDFAYCKLKEPINDIPPMPILMGCEQEYLKVGSEILLAGFGLSTPGKGETSATKRMVESKVVRFSRSGEVQVGATGKGPLQGDSGGPAYIKLDEKTFGKNAGWRVFGATSTSAGGKADGRAFYGQISKFVPYIEKHSKIDITPCTDAQGNWEPSKDCKGFPLDPLAGEGDWVNSCEFGPVGGYNSSCGDPFGDDEEEDTESPKVKIVSPKHKSSFEADENTVEVKVDASDNVEVASVTLRVNGKKQKKDKKAPYEWELEDLEPGTYELEATAKDEAGNKKTSKKVRFTIEEDDSDPSDDSDSPSESDDESDDSDDESDDSNDSDDESDNTDKDPKIPGVECSVREQGTWTWLALLPLVALLRRRRR